MAFLKMKVITEQGILRKEKTGAFPIKAKRTRAPFTFFILPTLIFTVLISACSPADPITVPSPQPNRLDHDLTVASLPSINIDSAVHSCAVCHGTLGRIDDSAFMPLAGMPREEMVLTLKNFRDGFRPSTVMGVITQGFTDSQLDALGDFYARQHSTNKPSR
jgi:cytochrome c553